MAYVLSSVSGNLISAASAGYAPTNSGEVSAIASAYQVVSATATQLYAGTAYVTSVNDAPISAARAGNAANASMANSAYYDGTGRLISSLPDSATVSAIASSYAESAASSKLDESATADFYSTSNPSGFITGVNLSDYATTAYVDSSISGFAYNSAVSGWTAKQDALTFGYNAEDKISGINGSALAGEGGGGLVTAIGTSESGITSINNSGLVDTAALRSSDYSSLYVQEPLYISASGDSSYIGISGDVGGIDSATCSAIASSYAESAASSKQDALTFGYNAADQISSIDGSALGGMDEDAVSAIASAYAESAASSKLDTTAYNSADFYSTSNPSGFIDSAYVDSAVSSKADASALSGYYTTANESGFITGVDLTDYATTAYVDSAVSSKADSSALSSYALSADVSGTVDLVSTQSANWGGSALALSAGPGVKLEKVGDTLVASTDETLLWSGNADVTSFPTTESPYHFKRLRFVQLPIGGYVASYSEAVLPPSASAISLMHTIASTGNWGVANTNFTVASTGFSVLNGMHLKYSAYNSVGISYLTGAPPRIGEIYGINRTAEA